MDLKFWPYMIKVLGPMLLIVVVWIVGFRMGLDYVLQEYVGLTRGWSLLLSFAAMISGLVWFLRSEDAWFVQKVLHPWFNFIDRHMDSYGTK